MSIQVSRDHFADALRELGHDPKEYQGKRLSLQGLCDLYEIEQGLVIEAIDHDLIAAHYDYRNDTIWVDALDAAHFYYCHRSQAELFCQK